MSDLVQYTLSDGTATLTLEDGKVNALSPAMIAAINAALDRAEREAEVVIITGRPGVLSAGYDLRAIESDPDAGNAMHNKGGELLVRIYLFPLPVIVASTGHAIAAGALLLLTADYRLSTEEDCKICLNEVAIGLPLLGYAIELAVARLANTSVAQTMLLSQVHSPTSAMGAGFVDELVPSANLLAAANEKARELRKLDGRAFAITKQGIRGRIVEKIAAHPPANLV